MNKIVQFVAGLFGRAEQPRRVRYRRRSRGARSSPRRSSRRWRGSTRRRWRGATMTWRTESSGTEFHELVGSSGARQQELHHSPGSRARGARSKSAPRVSLRCCRRRDAPRRQAGVSRRAGGKRLVLLASARRTEVARFRPECRICGLRVRSLRKEVFFSLICGSGGSGPQAPSPVSMSRPPKDAGPRSSTSFRGPASHEFISRAAEPLAQSLGTRDGTPSQTSNSHRAGTEKWK